MECSPITVYYIFTEPLGKGCYSRAKKRLEKLEEVSAFLDEAEGKFAELREENQFVG